MGHLPPIRHEVIVRIRITRVAVVNEFRKIQQEIAVRVSIPTLLSCAILRIQTMLMFPGIRQAIVIGVHIERVDEPVTIGIHQPLVSIRDPIVIGIIVPGTQTVVMLIRVRYGIPIRIADLPIRPSAVPWVQSMNHLPAIQ